MITGGHYNLPMFHKCLACRTLVDKCTQKNLYSPLRHCCTHVTPLQYNDSVSTQHLISFFSNYLCKSCCVRGGCLCRKNSTVLCHRPNVQLYKEKKQQLLKLEKLGPANLWYISSKLVTALQKLCLSPPSTSHCSCNIWRTSVTLFFINN